MDSISTSLRWLCEMVSLPWSIRDEISPQTPGKGYDVIAAEWRSKLDADGDSQPALMPWSPGAERDLDESESGSEAFESDNILVLLRINPVVGNGLHARSSRSRMKTRPAPEWWDRYNYPNKNNSLDVWRDHRRGRDSNPRYG
jgi:hypothetical protein